MHYLVSQLRFRKRRVVALGVAILAASASFSLLLSTVRTTRLEVVGTVKKNFRPAYDILVRPSNSFTPLEREQNLVRANYLGGIFGGISYREYRIVRGLAGVEVAAPIANVGYIMPFQFVPLRINRFLSGDRASDLYRLNVEWHANGGLSRYPDYDQYVYYSRTNRMSVSGRYASAKEVVGEGRTVPVCGNFLPPEIPLGRPFATRGREGLTCFSSETHNPMPSGTDFGRFERGFVGGITSAYFPVLLAAIDPAQEEKLVNFSETLVDGRPLSSDEGASIVRVSTSTDYTVVPLLASTRPYVDEDLVVGVERLNAPGAGELRTKLSDDKEAYRFAANLTGTKIGTIRLPIGPIYERLIEEISVPSEDVQISYSGYWTAGPNAYERQPDGTLRARSVRNPSSVFDDPYYSSGWAPQQLKDTQFRKLEYHPASAYFTGRLYDQPALRVVGRFDPEKLPGFIPLSEVPLETYYPPKVEPVDNEVRRVLEDESLLPTENIGGYIAQPPLMLTTIKGLRALTDLTSFEGANQSVPISVIRVRVAGVTGPDPLSRERIRRVAQLINERTGLAVDVTAGSSPRTLEVDLPAGEFGQPAMTVREGWVEKGVAVSFLRAIDRKSLVLFVLVLVVCGFFLANGALASVAARRRELGTLSCLGWSRPEVFRAVLGEFAAVGAIAGLTGVILVRLLVSAFELKLPLWQILLVAPVAVLLTAGAGIIPAYRASRLEPLDAIHPQVATERKARHASGVVRMALLNVRRVPARSALGAAGFTVGIAALTVIVAVNRAFQGELTGTVMGRFISLDIRSVDVLSVVLIILLGAISVADVLLLNLRERSAEFVTLQTLGWNGSQLRLLVAAEGFALGAIGSALGAAAALGLVSAIPGLERSEALVSAAVAVVVGCVAAVAASLAPLPALGRLVPSVVLGEE